ncbi:MAG: acyl-ACP--UDP-N-acetylglucosamine O-acyltransferase [Bauldia sp.]
MTTIHPTAIVEDGATLGSNVRIGPFAIVGADVVLEDGVSLHAHALVTGRTRIGAGTEIYSFAALGGPPQDVGYRNEPTSLVVGKGCIIREHVTVHRGTATGRKETSIGANCMLMVASHVAHDCVVGDSVVLVNQATIGGHCEVGEHAILGGLSAVKQRIRIGAHAFISGITGVAADVIPFASAVGARAELAGLNIVGLKRRGFDRPTIHALRAAYQAIFTGEGNRAARVERIAEEYGDVPAVMTIVDFVRASGDRPLVAPRD